MTQPFVLVSSDGGIGRITLNEPARLNPVTPARIAELVAACRTMSLDDAVSVVVITGSGRGFCSGADLTMEAPEDLRLGPASGSVTEVSTGMWVLPAMRQPVIAMVNGAAVGFGAELALCADLRIAGTSAMFRFPFSLLGSVSDTGAATWLLPRLVGWSRAAELLYSGRKVRSDEALDIGLVNQVVRDDDLNDVVDELASRLSSQSAPSLRQMKELIFAGLDECKAEHILRQQFAHAERDTRIDPRAYFDTVKGSGDST